MLSTQHLLGRNQYTTAIHRHSTSGGHAALWLQPEPSSFHHSSTTPPHILTSFRQKKPRTKSENGSSKYLRTWLSGKTQTMSESLHRLRRRYSNQQMAIPLSSLILSQEV